jgi:phthiodiolone/phenolphthiodiolone dimycocerosates ketoreductase
VNSAAPPSTAPIAVGSRVPAVPPLAAMRDAVAAEVAAGAASVWWPDHLLSFNSPDFWPERHLSVADVHTYLDPFVCIAACAEVAGDALLGVAVTDAVRRMPATLAQTALSLDHLAPGRVVLGLGAGEAANYEPYGWSVTSPARRLAEAAAAIRGHFDDGGPDAAGAAMGLRPAPGSSGPQLWLAAHGPRGLDLTGRHAHGWLPYHLDVGEWHAARDAIVESSARAGRPDGAVTLGLSVNAVIADRREDAHAVLDHPAVRALALLFPPRWYERLGHRHPLGASGLDALIATRMGSGLRAAVDAVPFEVIEQNIPHGTPADIAAHARQHDGLQHVRLADFSVTAGVVTAEASRERRAEVTRLLGAGSSASISSRQARS